MNADNPSLNPQDLQALLSYWRSIAETEGVRDGDKMTKAKAAFAIRIIQESPLSVGVFIEEVLGVSKHQFHYYKHIHREYHEEYLQAIDARRARFLRKIVNACHRTGLKMAEGYHVKTTNKTTTYRMDEDGKWRPCEMRVDEQEQFVRPNPALVIRTLQKHAPELMATPGQENVEETSYIVIRNEQVLNDRSLYPASGANEGASTVGFILDEEYGDAHASTVGQD